MQRVTRRQHRYDIVGPRRFSGDDFLAPDKFGNARGDQRRGNALEPQVERGLGEPVDFEGGLSLAQDTDRACGRQLRPRCGSTKLQSRKPCIDQRVARLVQGFEDGGACLPESGFDRVQAAFEQTWLVFGAVVRRVDERLRIPP